MQFRTIATVLGSAGYGALLGWAVTADLYQQRVLEAEEQTGIMVDYARELRAQIAASVPPVSELVETNGEVFEGEPTAESVVVRSEIPRGDDASEASDTDEADEVDPKLIEEARAHLEGVIQQYTQSDADPSFVEQAVLSPDRQVPPFVITKQDYSFDEEGQAYEKETLMYYPEFKTLLDDEMDVVENIDQIVGWKNLDRFGDESGDPDVVFIRNRRTQCDYEVERTYMALPLHVGHNLSADEFESKRRAGGFREDDV